MRKSLVVGILKETKPGETRAPLSPSDIGWLRKRRIGVEVESSPARAFRDSEYKRRGAKIVDNFEKASFLIGIKRPEIQGLYRDKVYMVFSHTTKGQPKNTPLLKECIRKNIALVDYEKITDAHGSRLVYFGRFAGICGAADSLHYLGRRLREKGIKNPFTIVRPASEYASLKDLKRDMMRVEKRISRSGLDRKISPFIIGITGHGRVSQGVNELLGLLHPIEIHPRDMERFVRHQRHMRNKIYKIVFHREEKFRSKNGGGFYFEEYLKSPRRFESNLDVYLPYLNILIHTSYWDRRYPRLVTKKMVRRLYRKRPFRLEFIGDISCDINGSIELTHRPTTAENPTFTYNPGKDKFVDGYGSDGITIMARDNLPAELPKDASSDFSALVREYVYQIAAHGVKDIANHVAIPKEIRRAVIVQGKRLIKPYSFLRKYL